MDSPKHFYLTFNPLLNDYGQGQTQAHVFFDLLKEAMTKDKTACAWWGKYIGPERANKLDFEKLKAVIEYNRQLGASTQLYICDYQHLWVGKVEEVKETMPKDGLTLEFYKDKSVEIWFKLSDFTLLTYNNHETASKLSDLYIENEFHELKIHGLSPFTTAVRYPAVVQDIAEEQYFDRLEDGQHMIFMPHPGLFSDSSRRVLEALNAYVFPGGMYQKIPLSARTEIESAELDIIENRYHNIKRNALSYIKALEILINDLVIGHLKRSGMGNDFFVKPETMPPKLYLEQEQGSVPISKWHKNYSLTQMIYFVDRCLESNNFCFKKAFQEYKPFIPFIQKLLPAVVKNNFLLEIRGTLAHNDSGNISDKDALVIRNLVLGIAQQGLMSQALMSFYHKDYRWLEKVQGDYTKVDFKKLKASA